MKGLPAGRHCAGCQEQQDEQEEAFLFLEEMGEESTQTDGRLQRRSGQIDPRPSSRSRLGVCTRSGRVEELSLTVTKELQFYSLSRVPGGAAEATGARTSLGNTQHLYV